MSVKKSKNALQIVPESNQKASCATKPQITASLSGKALPAQEFRGRAAVVTLGCAKNQVDSEVMMGVLKKSGYQLVSEVERADVAIVNTCGFLESAVQEGIDCILDIAELKKTGSLRKLIVGGCAVSRYKNELVEALPEVDAFISLDDILNVDQVADQNIELANVFSQAQRPYFLYDENMPRELSDAKHFAYVKVSEGCNRPCTFCIIPSIRGKLRSRSVSSVVAEVSSLGQQGVREINLVAQDLTAYGSDRGNTERLSDLLVALNDSAAVDWIRLLYAYPIGIEAELLRKMVELPIICNYLDLPLQHASEPVLKAMQRPLGRFSPINIIDFINATAPELKLRTTFIVGFPGETENDVEKLANFVRSGVFSSVGVFTYSQEIGTPAGTMDKQVYEKEKLARQAYIMGLQGEQVKKQLSSYVGKSLEVLVDGLHPESDLLISARTRFQAPDVDGTVIINDSDMPDSQITAGALCEVEITEISKYDLIGRVVRIIKPGGNANVSAVFDSRNVGLNENSVIGY